ncbi:MAG: pyridoxamine 5'-phosphate oxidase family protein [Actinomycetota bacterium]|nr:pyridoxamine 5'-phosphate oxidase family protein [Actinomycetota bacterium]
MRFDPHALPSEIVDFLTERHLATLTTLRADGTPHVTAIAFTVDVPTLTARVITSDGNQKVTNVERAGEAGAPAALAQVDGRRWVALEGRMRVSREPGVVRDAEQRYAGRYRVPKPNPQRVVLLMDVASAIGHF